ncbi:MAG: hypothetical protein GXY33_03960 [Phycisphaerae bacterium]|nr:hypothetical protein [Phycisphaerae bacterium]
MHRVVARIVQRLDNVDPEARYQAIRKLGEIRAADALDVLIGRFDDDDPVFRREVAQALGQIGDSRAVGVLLERLSDTDESVRQAAAVALGQINDRTLIPVLVKGLKDESWQHRRGCAMTLGELKAAEAVEHLVPALSDRNDEVRFAAATALGRIRDPRVVRHLVAQLGDVDTRVRESTVEALARIGDRRIIPQLVQALETDNWTHRHGCALALGRLKAVEAIAPLVARLSDEDREVRELAAGVLEQIDPQWHQSPRARRMIPKLINRLEAESPYVRALTAEVLGRIGDPKALDALIGRLEDEPQVRYAAVRGLGELGEPAAVPHILEHLDADRQYLHLTVEALLGIRERNGRYIDAWPNVFCRECLTRAVRWPSRFSFGKRLTYAVRRAMDKSALSGPELNRLLFKPFRLVTCRKCGLAENLEPGVALVIGVIGGKWARDQRTFSDGDRLYVLLWDEDASRATAADIDELEVRNVPNTGYDRALNVVWAKLHEAAGEEGTPTKKIPVRLVDDPPLSESALELLKAKFKKILR